MLGCSLNECCDFESVLSLLWGLQEVIIGKIPHISMSQSVIFPESFSRMRTIETRQRNVSHSGLAPGTPHLIVALSMHLFQRIFKTLEKNRTFPLEKNYCHLLEIVTVFLNQC